MIVRIKSIGFTMTYNVWRATGALVLALIVTGCGGTSATSSTRNEFSTQGGVELVYRAGPTPESPTVTPDALNRAIGIVRDRIRALGVGAARVTLGPGSDEISVRLPGGQDNARLESEVGATAQLYFSDWEANALTANGKTVASQLLAQSPEALAISNGGAGGPGGPGAGGTALYDAVRLAAKQPAVPVTPRLSRLGPQYYLFGNGGTPACAAAAKVYDVLDVAAGNHCLLSGPDPSMRDLKSDLPPRVRVSQGQLLAVPQGTVVLQAVPASFSNPPKGADPTTQFYVLKDKVSLFGTAITDPQQSTDAGGNPDVEFGFTPAGQKAFQKVTAAIAKRGSLLSGAGSLLEQHFAVVLDNLLITVPYIDFKAYPLGIPASRGADITGGFTVTGAQDLATELRFGALPISLTLVSEGQVAPKVP